MRYGLAAVFAMIGASCEPRLECADGTRVEDGFCVVESALSCGSGTMEVDGECVQLLEPLECGPGTVAVDGVCVVESPTQCGEGTILVGDECVPANVVEVYTPFEEGTAVRVSQGHHGFFSHNGYSGYAVDFPAPEGTVITAAVAGRVARIKEDSDEGCGEARCSNLGNYVVLDHGDGTLGTYFHLQFEGALVEIGDRVPRGAPIGLSGNTGWSTGPHLHFEISNLMGHSLPVRFAELLEENDGTVFHGAEFVSENVEDAALPAEAWSSCQRDTYAPWGVTLEDGFPCVALELDEEYVLEGHVAAPNDHLLVYQYSRVDGAWIDRCIATEADGTFAIPMVWRSSMHRSGSYLFMDATNSGCGGDGWASSPELTLLAPPL